MEGKPALVQRADGQAGVVVNVLRDVTVRHAVEELLAIAKREAEKATAVKSEFLSNMSHELRTPLTSIIGYAELLVGRGKLEGDERRYLDRIIEGGKALLTIVNDILDFSKLEARQVMIERRPIDPSALGASALDLLSPQASAKGLTLQFEWRGEPTWVMADETRIKQILLNLIGNAVKFTAAGEVGVRASYDLEAKALRYEVSDTGPGIRAERMGLLFQRFSQVDASTTRSFGGTGLGLAICKGLAEAMGGEVGVSSIPDQGSCFWVEIPCDPAEAVESADEAGVDAYDPADALNGLRLLIVDDNARNRELTKIITAPFGVVASEASGGREAVSMAEAEPFDIILMDVRMPDIDGLKATQLIRSQPGPNRASPIIGFSAEASGGDMPEAWRGVFDDRLAKPIVATDLLAILASWSPLGAASAPQLSAANGDGRSLV